jgi:hypothetical protein
LTIDETPLSVPCIKGHVLCICIGHEEYKKGLTECQNALWGRLTLNKGDKPDTMCDLIAKLGQFWKQHVNGKWYRLAANTVFHNGRRTLIITRKSRLMHPFGFVWFNYHRSIGGKGR